MIYWNFKNWIHISISSPFKTMKKLKGVFIPLKRHFKFGKDSKLYHPFIYCPQPARILIRSCDVMWKDKFDTPRYECPPYIWIHLFGYSWIWYWRLDDSYITPWLYTDDYWEQALWYLYYTNTISQGLINKPDIEKAKESWPWINYDTKKSNWNDKFLIK